jgi:hypothetical protein
VRDKAVERLTARVGDAVGTSAIARFLSGGSAAPGATREFHSPKRRPKKRGLKDREPHKRTSQ